MLQTPGSLKNRDVSLTAFSPPRTGSVWGDNWRVPWHAARERAAHSATQTLAHVSVCVKTTDRRRACLFACASVCAYARVYQRRRVIILFFLRRNPFLLSLRAPRSNEGWTWKGLTAVLRTACALCFFLFIPPSWCHSLLPLLHLLVWNSSCVAWTTVVCELPLLLSLLRLRDGCARSNMADSMASFLSFLSFRSKKKKKFSACLLEQGILWVSQTHKRKVYKESCVEMQKLETGGSVNKKKAIFHQSPNCEFGIDKMLI